jgi:CubicO group peptidase (beta-lactamase class C family)
MTLPLAIRRNDRLSQLIWPLAICLALLFGPVAHGQLASAPSLPRGDAREAGFDPGKLRAIDDLIAKAVENRQVAGAAALVARRGKVVHLAIAGLQDAEAGVPVSGATIYRIASMTKPITSVAAMMLVEEGKMGLDDPVAKYIPEFKSLRVLLADARPGEPLASITTDAKGPVTIRHLLTHTSGISYSLWDKPVLGQLYRDAGVSDGLIETPGTMADNVRRLASMPLMFQPGTAWEYGLNTDVLGRVVEVASGQTLDEFFAKRIFQPLRMNDTHFVLPEAKRPRLATLYAPDDAKQIRRVGAGPQQAGAARYSATYPLATGSQYQSGGAGLVSTIGDYARFLQMLANRGQLDGVRLLKPETVDEMTKNQIGDFASFPVHGDKFGYGFGVVTAAGRDEKEVGSVGSYSWGGIFYTYFLVDPQRELTLIFMTQVFPFEHLTLHGEFKRLTYAAMVR